MNDLKRIDESVTRKRTLLHEAILKSGAAEKEDSEKVAASLLIGNPECIEAMDEEGRRPLHFAAYKHDCKIIQALLNQGADIQATDSKGRKPIDYLIFGVRDLFLKQQSHEIIEDPIKLVASFQSIIPIFTKANSDLLLKDMIALREVPLHTVVIVASVFITNAQLLQNREKIISQFDEFIRGRSNIKNKINQQDVDDKTPLHYAVLLNCPEMIALLCDLGANIDLKDNQHYSPIWYTTARNRTDFLEAVNKAKEAQTAEQEAVDLSAPSCSNR